MSGIAIAGSGGSGSIVIGTTTIGGGTDTCVLFQKGSVVGEDTNFEWDYTNHILNLGPNARLNSIGTTWRFDVGGTNRLDWNITQANAWTFNAFMGGQSASGSGFFARVTGDTNSEIGIEVDTTGFPYIFMGPGNTFADIYINRQGQGIVGISHTNPINPAGLRVYNTSDNPLGNPTANYERGVFDWTTTSNVLTVGTQKGGTGTLRNVKFITGTTYEFDIGGTNKLDYNISVANSWTTNYWQALGNSGSFTGFFVRLASDSQQRIFFALDGNDKPTCGFGAGGVSSVDANIVRYGQGILGLSVAGGGNALNAAATWQVYNTIDTPGNPTNYERGVFDWTTTSNVLTIGTQKGGSGAARVVNLASTSYIEFSAAGGVLVGGSNSQPEMAIGSDWGLVLGGLQSVIAFTNNNAANAGTVDLQFSRGGAGILAIGNGSNVAGVVWPISTTFANLPASPTQGMMANITDGLAANCADGSCTTFGTNVTGGTGALKLNLWYNGTHWTLIGK